MRISGRSIDERKGMAIPEGTVTAPKAIREAVGSCRECLFPISTHAYELVLETADSETAKIRRRHYDSVILCEKCYHRTSESFFVLSSISQLGRLATMIGVGLVVIAFLLLFLEFLTHAAIGLAIAGFTLLVISWVVLRPVAIIHNRKAHRFGQRHFAAALKRNHKATLTDWWDNSIANVVPSALAVLVNAAIPVEGISRHDFRRILTGELRSWRALGGPDQSIRVYLPIGPWREWTFLESSILAQFPPGPHGQLQQPIDVVARIKETSYGIGVLSILYEHLIGEDIRVLKVDDETCSPQNERYPFWLSSQLFPVADVPQSD